MTRELFGHSLLALCLAGCSCGPEPVRPAVADLPEARPPTAATPTPVPEAVVAGDPVAAAAVVEAAPPPLFYGEILGIDTDPTGEGETLYRMLVAERPPIPRPPGEPLGYALAHQGAWEIHAVSEEPSPYATVGVVSYGEPCDARVIRARTLYGSIDDYEDPDGLRETSFYALEIEGCEGGFGVAGRALVTTRLAVAAPPPASPARVAQIAALDALYADDPWRDTDEVQALELPEHDLAVVFGNRTWVVLHGSVVVDRYGGDLEALVQAGDQLFFVVYSPSVSWMSSLASFVPPRADGEPSNPCTVVDTSGTPLNVHAEAGARTAVVGTLPNGARVDAHEELRGWRRIDAEVDGWVYAEALRCD